MFIKTLTIQGFKSYHDQTQIEEFSPKHNVVVGRNGSGKSNFFAAIRFVLSDAYTTMTREERQALLHEGVSITTTLSAFVEIIFDNSDNRFPTGKEEVILRRTIGLKKDEYSLDKKSVSKADVMNLLESAGFSRANPYYIVPQGRITYLTNAKDHERLALLKEVAGTKVYEQRRTESLKIMADTQSKRDKIAELLEYIETRLNELEEEKQELKEWTEKDRERRGLEYAMYERELLDVTTTLTELEEERQRDLENAKTSRDAFSHRERDLQALEADISEQNHIVTVQKLSKVGTQAELSDLIKSRTELECTVADLQAASQRSGGTLAELQADLAALDAEIQAKEGEIDTLGPQWDDVRARGSELKRSLDEKRGRLDGLYAKQGRSQQFRTKAERDAYLKSEIASLEKYQSLQNGALQQVKGDLKAANDRLQQVSDERHNTIARADDIRAQITKLSDQIAKDKDWQEEKKEQRKSLWREDARLDSLVSRATEEMRSADQTLASMMDRDTGSGLRAIERIMDRPGFEGVYGPLYRLFEVDQEEYNLAVELTAGNSLFHIVVDTDQTAQRVLELMMKEKTGRVTFMPINRLKPKNPNLPVTDEAFPLIDKLRFDDQYSKAFQQVFGKTCICRDLIIAAAYVKSHNINTITLDGDKVDRKGALTGGYHDVRRSRLEAIANAKNWRRRYEEEGAKSKEVKAGILKLEQEITRASGNVQVSSNTLARLRSELETLLGQERVLDNESDSLRDQITRLESRVEDVEAELGELKTKIAVFKEEMKTPLNKTLTDDEETTLAYLSQEVDELQQQLIEAGKEKAELSSRRNSLQVELKENLRRRREDLRLRMDGLGSSRASDAFSSKQLETKSRELQVLVKSIDAAKKRVQDSDKDLDKSIAELQRLRKKLEDAQIEQSEDSRNISKQQKSTERYHAKRQILVTRKDECNRNIRDLGVLPDGAYEKYKDTHADKLVKKLHAVNQGLKKFAHVNKKAFEQYNNFTKQRDQLIQRRTDLEDSANSITELVDVLDQRKDEAIERTFKQVAKNFEDVFEQLVPAGRGRLIIQRRVDQDQTDENDVDESQHASVDNYTGIAIKVSFNSKVDEGLRIQQLSGGQKSLVALALVFSIQKCDPAPFYLFDEIDANLDAQYRTAVANMIHTLAEGAQFITTTFRPEMLVTADKFYGVLFNKNKISTIRRIEREEAQEFVDQEARAQ